MRKVLTFLSVFLFGIGVSQLFFLFQSQKQIPQTNTSIENTPQPTSITTAITKRDGESTIVSRVIDGDTVELSDGRKLRYIGIDTPEIVHPEKPVECFGREAKLENEKLVNGRTVRLEKDISETDKYGRLLRYLYVGLPAQAGDVFVNDYLIRLGFAHASTYPPDVKYSQQFLEAEREARENNRGLWAGCTFENSSGSGLTTPQGQTPSSGLSSSCVIKGNISSSGEKIYHLPGCGSYDKTSIDESKGEQWFCTEDDAVSAGWRKAKNC